MRNVLGFFIAVFLWSVTSVAGAQEQEEKKSFLWKVTSPQTTVYLLGSIHVGSAAVYPLNPAIEQAFEQAQILVVEVDVEKGQSESLQQLILQKGTYQDDDRLENHITEKTRIRLKEVLKGYGLTVDGFSRFKPWFVGNTLLALQLKRAGFDEELGIDRYFLRKAREQRKKIFQLETMEQQFALFDSIPEQDMFLEYSISSMAEIEGMLAEFQDAWKNGDEQTVERIVLQEPLRRNPDSLTIIEKTIYDRNTVMAGRIEGFLAGRQIYFVIVGSGHVVGEKGILNLLRQKGYQVEQQ